MTFEDAKDEILALIGPDARLVDKLRKGGLHVHDWHDTGNVEIKFMVEDVIVDWPFFKVRLVEAGEAVGLFLQTYGHWWTGHGYEGRANFTRKRPSVLTNNDDCR